MNTTEGNSTYRKVSRRIVAPLLVAYIIAYLDRVNVGFAKLQMLQALSFSETSYGLGAGVFFIGYFLFGIPGNLALHKVGARRWLAAIMICWGLISSATALVQTPLEFYVLRFVLGTAEAGFFPGVIFYLSQWFPEHRRTAVTASFMTAIPICGAVGSPLSGWIMQRLGAYGGLTGWQWLFVAEALPAVGMGLYLLGRLDDSPRSASWLSEDEKRLISSSFVRDAAVEPMGSFLAVLRDDRVWLVGLIYFCAVIGLYGIGFWLPTVVSEMGVHEPIRVGLFTAVPYGAAAIGMVLTARSADRHGEHRWHVAVPATAAALALAASATFSDHRLVAMSGLTVATWGLLTVPPLIWSIPTAFRRGAVAAFRIGMINSFGNLAGFVSPYAVGWIKDRTGSTAVGMDIVAACVLLSGVLVIFGIPGLSIWGPSWKSLIRRRAFLRADTE